MTPALMPRAIFRAAFTERAALNQAAREPSAQQAANSSGGIGNPRERAHLFGVEVAHVIEIFRQPEDIEVPGGVTKKLGDDQSRDLRMTQKIEPMDRLAAVALRRKNFGQFLPLGRTQAAVLSGRVILGHPPRRPR